MTRRPHRQTPTWLVVQWVAQGTLLAAVTSCALFQRFSFTPPTVALETITVTGLDFSGGSLRLLLDVYNPNPYELKGAEFRASVDLEQTPFGEVVRNEPLALPGSTHAPVEVDVRFTWQGVGAAARGLFERGAVAYALNGSMLVDTPVDQRRVKIGTKGSVTMEQLLR
jgi:LEA14-like dessication related protein